MRLTVKWNVLYLGLAVSLACATGAYADSVSWTITDIGSSDTNPASGSGTITYDPSQESGGGYLVTSFTGTITIAGVGTGTIDYTLPSGTAAGAVWYDPTNAFIVDDLFFPSGNNQQGPSYLDEDGLLFYLTGLPGYASSDPFNLWGNGPGNYTLDGFNGSSYMFDDTIDFSDPPSVPEPSVMAMLSLGLLGLMFAKRRKQLLATC